MKFNREDQPPTLKRLGGKPNLEANSQACRPRSGFQRNLAPLLLGSPLADPPSFGGNTPGSGNNFHYPIIP